MGSYGGFWARTAAWLIDTIILMVAGGVLGGLVGAVLGGAMAGGGSDVSAIALAAGAVGNVLSFLMNWLYSALLESSERQATVGKMALGLIVTDQSGGRIGFGRATGRYFAKILSGLILLIGFFMVGWTERKQGLHDMIAGTLVMKKGAEPAAQVRSVFE